ncbi:MAG: exo-1,3-beta-glucanase [Phylliscum demangeonii]|nr:MAG: exo-1,3-beta-glucanase [Phylliscum demangeonii]
MTFLQRAITTLLVASAVSALPTSTLTKRNLGFNFNQQTVRGVNIGGWLVLEPWITPSIFQKLHGVVDEFTLTQQLGPDTARSILKSHWDSWATLQDFQRIAGAGFNTVRIPIGYWAFKKFDNDPYIQGAADYLDAAISWARSTGLKVWIDLHGAPGSQNGFDNSGHRTGDIAFTHGNHVQNTLEVLGIISDRYAGREYNDVVVAIELVNEPLPPGVDLGALKSFYRSGYGKVRSKGDAAVVLSDAFQTTSSWNGFLSPSDNNAQGVIMDHHDYQVFDDDMVAWPSWKHRQEVCNRFEAYSHADKWTVVGEWSAAMTDCAAALNGYGIGARYEGLFPGSHYVGSCAHINFIETWDQNLRDDTRMFIEAQIATYERYTRGWIFWNFRTEASPEWDLFRLLDAKLFPQPLTERKFGVICA